MSGDSQPTTESRDTRERRLETVVRTAALSWTELQKMYDAQDEIRRRGEPLPTWPRDRFESFIDALTEEALRVLGNG